MLAAIINRAAFAALIEAENQTTRHSRIAIDDAGLSDEIIGKAFFDSPFRQVDKSHETHDETPAPTNRINAYWCWQNGRGVSLFHYLNQCATNR